MTIPRNPLSIDAAMGLIMSRLGGWSAVAAAAGVASPRTCEKWGAFDIAEAGDPEARDIPMRKAVLLDIAYQAAGGVGAPIMEAYAQLVKVAAAEEFGDKQQLLAATMDFMSENNEAELALLEATRPHAGAAEIANALKQLMDVKQDADEIIAGLSGRQQKPP